MRLLLVSLAIAFAVTDSSTLNKLLDERTELNQQYKKENVESACEMTYAKQLTEYETGVADAWLDLIKFAKESDSLELKKIVLRMEYYDELRNYTYELEFAETDEDLAEKGKKGVEKYRGKLEAIE